MGIIGVIAVFILLIIVCNKASRALNMWASARERKAQTEAFYKQSMLSSLQGIEQAVTPEPVSTNPGDALLRANQKLIEKREVKNAIEDELGIT